MLKHTKFSRWGLAYLLSFVLNCFPSLASPDVFFGGKDDRTDEAEVLNIEPLISVHEVSETSVLLLPRVGDLRRAIHPEKSIERLMRSIRRSQEGNPATRITLVTTPPVLNRMEDSILSARNIRKLAFDEGLDLIDLHDELTSGRNALSRFTSDGFLFRAVPHDPPKCLRKVIDVAAWPRVESSGRAIRYGHPAPSVNTNEVPDLTGNWTPISSAINTNEGVFAIRCESNLSDLVMHPMPFSKAGPGRLNVLLGVSRKLEAHDLPYCFVQDKDGFSFQLPPTEAKRKGGLWSLSYDLTANSIDCRAVGHAAAWCETYRRRCSKVGFSVFRKTAEPVTFTFESIEYEPVPWEAKPIRILDFRAPSHGIPAYGTLEPRFHVDGLPPGNYFDPEVVRVICEVDTPSGTTNQVNGFLHQDFVRRLVDGSENLTASGPLEWRVRYTPTEPGKHWYRIGVKVPGSEIWSAKYALHCTASSPDEQRGFIRIAKNAPKMFEDERGNGFFPVGLNMHNPIDARNEEAFGAEYKSEENPGTFIYERVMKRLAEAGGNAATVWMSPWWLEFEWTATYPGCHGLNDYNLERAWQLDKVMELAKANGIRINLSIENHGKFSAFADPQWDENPYNLRHGGPVSAPDQFFTSLEARDIYRKKLDYLLARWGHDPQIMSFELASEADFFGSRLGFGTGPEVRNWHVATAKYIKENHPYPHLVSCHYAIDMSRVDPKLAAHPMMDFYGVDAYSRTVDSSYPVLLQNDRTQAAPEKPYMTWEFGGSPRGASKVQLTADLHFGLWSSLFLDSAGAPFLWWYEFVDRENLYPNIKSFQAFAKDVDKRRPSEQAKLVAENDKDVKGFARIYTPANGDGPLADGWVYSESAIHAKLNWVPAGKSKSGDFPALPIAPVKQDPVIESEETKGARLRIPGTFPPGVSVEFWDTRKGEVIGGSSLLAGDDGVVLELPAFFDSIAFRIVGP